MLTSERADNVSILRCEHLESGGIVQAGAGACLEACGGVVSARALTTERSVRLHPDEHPDHMEVDL